LLLQPLFWDPVVGRPALGGVNEISFGREEWGVVLGVTVGVYGREGHAAIEHIEVWLVGFIKRPSIVIWNCFGESYDLIWGKCPATSERRAIDCGSES
jgi:hypothetical protein